MIIRSFVIAGHKRKRIWESRLAGGGSYRLPLVPRVSYGGENSLKVKFKISLKTQFPYVYIISNTYNTSTKTGFISFVALSNHIQSRKGFFTAFNSLWRSCGILNNFLCFIMFPLCYYCDTNGHDGAPTRRFTATSLGMWKTSIVMQICI